MKGKCLMNSKTLMFITLIIMCFGLVFIHERYFIKPDIERIDTILKVDTIRHVDTFNIEKTKPIYIKTVKIDTLYNNIGDTVQLVKENKVYKDSIITCAGDSLEVTSYISGYEAEKDSLKVKLSRREIIKTEYITKYITQPKNFKDHFKIGAGIGYGYGLNNKEFEPYIGINFGYNFDF